VSALKALTTPRAPLATLFATDGYRRLKARETGMGRPFSDSAFALFVRSDTLRARAATLRQALSEWEHADLSAAAARALAYLPPDAKIHATVYVVVKPITNSFVWDTQTDPAIFLYLDPAVTAPQFENTVAHELHHIGYASISARTDSLLAGLPDSVRAAAEWMGAFGEGFAMLAAAGGPGVHPHAASLAAERERWDHDVANVKDDLQTLEAFFWDVITKRLATPAAIANEASQFYGVQGPWYTVGWKMSVVIERIYGRTELIQCMMDPRRLLARYNAAAATVNEALPNSLGLWSPELLKIVGADRVPSVDR
jgi:hypothetical protein